MVLVVVVVQSIECVGDGGWVEGKDDLNRF